MNKIKVKKLSPHAKLPKKAHDTDAGWDLYSTHDVYVKDDIVTLVRTGIAVQLPNGYEMQIRPRSGLAKKYGIFVVNAPGTIDEGYTGEVGVLLSKIKGEPFLLPRGSRIAQAVINKIPECEFEEVDSLDDTERGETGYGDSGL